MNKLLSYMQECMSPWIGICVTLKGTFFCLQLWMSPACFCVDMCGWWRVFYLDSLWCWTSHSSMSAAVFASCQWSCWCLLPANVGTLGSRISCHLCMCSAASLVCLLLAVLWFFFFGIFITLMSFHHLASLVFVDLVWTTFPFTCLPAFGLDMH